MKKVLKYMILTVVLVSNLYAAFFLFSRNTSLTIVLNRELALAVVVSILAGITLVMMIYHIVKDNRTYKRIKEMNEFLEAERKEERVKELLDAIEGNKYGE